jgi:hypothetical protein
VIVQDGGNAVLPGSYGQKRKRHLGNSTRSFGALNLNLTVLLSFDLYV